MASYELYGNDSIPLPPNGSCGNPTCTTEINRLQDELSSYKNMPPTFETCRKELADAVLRYKQLQNDTTAVNSAEHNLKLVVNEVLNQFNDEYGKRIEEQDKHIEALQKQLECANNALQKKEDLIMQLTTNLRVEQAKHVADITNLMDAIEALKRAHAHQLAGLTEQLKRAMDECFAYMNQIHDLNDLIARLTAENRELTRIHAECGPRQQALQDEIDRMRKLLQGLTAERDDLRDQLAKMRARCSALEAELAAMGEMSYSARKSSEGQEAAMMAMRAQMAQKEAAMRQALVDGERALEAAQTQARALITAGPPKELVKGLQDELAGLKEQLAAAQAEKAAAARQMSSSSSRTEGLMAELANKDRGFENERKGLMGRCEAMQGRISELEKKLRDLQDQSNNDRLRWQAEMARLQQMHAEEIAALKQDLDGLRDMLEKMKRLKDAAEEESRNRLRSLIEEQAKNDALNTKLAALTKRYEELRRDYDLLADELRKAKSDLAAKDSEVLNLQNELAKLRGRLSELESNNSGIPALRAQIAQMEGDLRALQRENDSLRDQLAALKDQLVEAKRAADQARADLANCKREKEILEAKLKDALAEIERLKLLLVSMREEQVRSKTTTRKETVPPHVQKKMDDLTKQLALMQELSRNIKDDMHPDHLVVVEEESMYASASSSTSIGAMAGYSGGGGITDASPRSAANGYDNTNTKTGPTTASSGTGTGFFW